MVYMVHVIYVQIKKNKLIRIATRAAPNRKKDFYYIIIIIIIGPLLLLLQLLILSWWCCGQIMCSGQNKTI